jgi:hypothetical protein
VRTSVPIPVNASKRSKLTDAAAGTFLHAFAHETNVKPEGEWRQCGQTGLMHVRLLLTQHLSAVAAMFMLRCSLRRGSGRSKLQSRWISNRPFAASCSSSHIADKPVIHHFILKDHFLKNGSSLGYLLLMLGCVDVLIKLEALRSLQSLLQSHLG